ncbi:helix-turn-helix transcriptional regulator [Sphingomonas sp. AOB5]|uniref:helix-turn-helix domain-containing protein n=1 Tax=Sphingomonas sp. AOB5 TaxID=3034017 RepID=UPI0023F702AF|nr:helix-turn-helix transcriptional regulator [Sphingomonas sp. AOB5]MDF7774282.1 helix-turn-helix transcriptional regulator [Sphingomonas sp. AOB5]
MGGQMPQARKSAFEPQYIEIIDRLIARRRAVGMSQVELAAQYGEEQTFISRMERKQRRMDVWEFVRFCRILNVDPAEVLKGLE